MASISYVSRYDTFLKKYRDIGLAVFFYGLDFGRMLFVLLVRFIVFVENVFLLKGVMMTKLDAKIHLWVLFGAQQ